MSTAVPIILIIVVWLFVLAPWLLRSQRPMSRTGEGFEDTRVLFSGDSGSLQQRRRPRLSERDVRRRGEDVAAEEDYELVEGEPTLEGEGAGAPASGDAEPAPDTVDGELATPEEDAENEAEEGSPQPTAEPEEQSEDDSRGEADELLLPQERPKRAAHGDEDSASREGDSSAGDAEVFSTPAPGELAQDAYPLDESFVSPVDLMYPGAVDTEGDVASAGQADAVAGAPGGAEPESPLQEESRGTASPVRAQADLSAEDLAFAQRRLGRGGWDPAATEAASADRYQRRRRTLIGLAVAVVATVAVGIVVGGWTWWLAAIAGALSAIYLVALRRQVRREQDLMRRRIEHLRRARLGVRNADDEALAIPRNLRRPGAIVLEIDDDSPDFDHLPLYDGERFDDYDGPQPSVAARRDDLAARRVS